MSSELIKMIKLLQAEKDLDKAKIYFDACMALIALEKTKRVNDYNIEVGEAVRQAVGL